MSATIATQITAPSGRPDRSVDPTQPTADFQRLRSICPDVSVQSELVFVDEENVLVKATVSGTGLKRFTAYGSNKNRQGFPVVERAESKAIRHAIRSCLVDIEARHSKRSNFRKMDSLPDAPRHSIGNESDGHHRGGTNVVSLSQPASERQLKFIAALYRQIGLTGSAMAADIERLIGIDGLERLDRRDASNLIEQLRQRTTPEVMAS